MTLRGKLGLSLFFLIGLIILFFVIVSFYSSASNLSLKNIFFSNENDSSPEESLSGDVSVKSFPVNSHTLWVIEMKGENNAFEPPTLIVNEGDVVDIRLAAMDRDYEIYLPGLGIYKLVAKGKKSEIQFQAFPAGEHIFGCKAECANPPRASLVINR